MNRMENKNTTLSEQLQNQNKNTTLSEQLQNPIEKIAESGKVGINRRIYF